ncbi:MAG: thioredoxin family protein [Steroidobacteraceae bacterium]
MKTAAAAIYLFALTLLSTVALANEIPFNQAQFDAARAAGTPVAVVFHADWCPTCRAQAPVLKGLTETPEFKSLTLYIANFDTENALKKSLGVTKQSTIVVFRNGREAARSTGDTQQDNLAALLRHAIS